jgi:cytochrome c peroxidase
LDVLALVLAAPLALGACETLGEDAVTETSGAAMTDAIANPNGMHQTVSTTGSINTSNEFFQPLGTNGRSCGTCHDATAAWTITPALAQAKFNASQGLDPLFRLNDGANSPHAPVATLAQRQAAYTQVLQRGLIRVGIGIPANAEFHLTLVEDPYGFATANEMSLYRRPLPSTNLKFLSAVMWDGRETQKKADGTLDLTASLLKQSNDATLGHAQAATALTAQQQQNIVNFETALFTAQVSDSVAGSLTALGATGGPTFLSNQNFFFGINDPLGGNPQNIPFTSKAMTLYDSWASQSGSAAANRRASIARGQAIFNTRVFQVQGVRGVNDVLGVSSLSATCTTCHDAPNAGDHSTILPLDLGLTDPNTFNTDIMPRYTLCKNGTDCSGANSIRTSDPGRAMITGKWADIAKFKGPVLRGLAGRAPYFHNGFGSSLLSVVQFYDQRFHIGFDATQMPDLVNFLQSL